ncbi:MAG: hypothetical protein ACKO1K_11130, partial [Burkholderiales bacterium]
MRIVEGILAIAGWCIAGFVVNFFFLVEDLFREAIEDDVLDDLAEQLVAEHFWTNDVWYGVFGGTAAIAFFLAAHGSLSNAYSYFSMGLFACAAAMIALAFYARGVRLAAEAEAAELLA